MVQKLEGKRQSASFPETAPAANSVFFKTYSYRIEVGFRESYDQVCDSVRGASRRELARPRNRTIKGLVEQNLLPIEGAQNG